jgi:glycine/D-amino acid oxidase-like deaminating enzyme
VARYSIFENKRANRLMNKTDNVDVVIIGAGIIGTSAAYYLAKKGLSVALCDKGIVAGEQSSRNWGFVRQQGRDPVEIPIIMRSLKLWGSLSKEINDDLGFTRSGTFYLADTEQQLAGYEAWLEHAKQFQLDTHLVSKTEIRDKLPNSNGKWIGALHTPSDGRAEPTKATSAISRAAQRLGVTIRTNCAVRGLETTAGLVSGVATEHGSIKTNAVLCAAGAWSSLFCACHNIALPQLKVRSSVFRIGSAPIISEHSIWCRDVALRRRQDGGYTVAHGSATEVPIVPDTFRLFKKFLPNYKLERKRLRLRFDQQFFKEMRLAKKWGLNSITPFEVERINKVQPNQKIINEAVNNLKRLFPELRNIEIIESWAGLIDVTPDAVSVICPIESIPGFFLATGFSGHGFGIGPAAGELASEMVMGSAVKDDLRDFQLERFY